MKSVFSFPTVFSLSLITLTCQQMAASAQNITYGQTLYIQNFNLGSVWVMRTDGSEIQDIFVWDVLQREDEITNAEFSFVSQTNLPANQDPKQGQCVKYGDTFYISDTQSWFWAYDAASERILSNAQVDEQPQQLWTVRSNQGNGLTDLSRNSDPLSGSCVQENAVVFIQLMAQNGIWAGAYGVGPDNFFAGGNIGANPTSSVSTPITDPMWILAPELSNGSTNYALACPGIPNASTGKWEIVQGSINSQGQSIDITTGTTTTTSSSITQTQKWQASITSETTEGFSFEGATAQEKLTVGLQFGQQQSESVSNAVTHSKTVQMKQQFAAGQVWQFKYSTQDSCDISGFDIFVNEFALTNSSEDYPCCLPGYFADSTTPHGPCLSDSPCACGPDICNPTSKRALRGSQKN